MAPDEEADDVRCRAVSSVSIRFLSSTADSSWAVPSVASRSSIALTTPWRLSRATRNTMKATMTMIRIWTPCVRRVSTRSLSGGLLKSIDLA